MSRVVSTKSQLEKLVELMEAHQDIAKGVCSKARAAKKWTEFASVLNSLGPPERSVDKWMKVWADYKFKIKKKKQHNNAEFKATGGGPNTVVQLSNLEESVVSLLQLETCSNPPGKEFGCATGVDENAEQIVLDTDSELCDKFEDTPRTKIRCTQKKSESLDALLALKREKYAFNKQLAEKKIELKERQLNMQEEQLKLQQQQLELQQRRLVIQEAQFSVDQNY